MNSRLLVAVAIAGSVTLSASAGWSRDADKDLGKGRDTDIYLPVPQPEIDLKTDQVQASQKRGFTFEADVSSWTPSSYNTTNSGFDTSDFGGGGVPKLSINVWNPEAGMNIGHFNLAPKFGLSYELLSRSGTVNLVSSDVTVNQNMNLFSARAGLELTSARGDYFGFVRPYLDVSLLPTWALATSSEIDNDGSSHGYLNFEEVGGLAFMLPHLASMMGAQNLALELGIEGTEGVAGSPLSGFGILAGTRIEL